MTQQYLLLAVAVLLFMTNFLGLGFTLRRLHFSAIEGRPRDVGSALASGKAMTRPDVEGMIRKIADSPSEKHVDDATATAGRLGSLAPATGKAMTQADVEAMIKKIADGQSEKLNWQQSIVDLMKLLKLDSSLTARKQLAQELGYKGSLDGSAEMNIWLHKQVMTKLAETGSLKHA